MHFQSCTFLRLIFWIILSIGIPRTAVAQLCTGSLGDAVVNITFGESATNPGVTPPAAYIFTSSSCPDDGYYTITRSTSSCFGNTWHSVPSDHTGSGAFMLVNATFQPGDFFVTTVKGLCPNTTYEFASWVMNVINVTNAIEPNITFKIETPAGVVLNEFNSGAIPASTSPVWKQYGFFFTTTTGNTDIVLRMTNNAPGGIGNDLALDDITFKPCGPVINSIIVGSGTENIIEACLDDQQTQIFTAELSPGFSQPVFQWQQSKDNGSTWTDISGATSSVYQRLPSLAGNFSYRLTVAENGNAGISACRIASNILTVLVHPKPVVNAGPDRTLIKGDQITLAATTGPETVTYQWSPPAYLSNTAILNPNVNTGEDINYTLRVTSEHGCFNEDVVSIKVINGLYVPSGFTPNDDGHNDTWRIRYLDPVSSIVTIYNRYGRIVYHVAGIEANWDGKLNGVPQPGGVYVYYIRFSGNNRMLRGTITLIR